MRIYRDDLLDEVGKIIVKEVRDQTLKHSMLVVNLDLVNPILLEKYKVFSALEHEEKEKMCDLLSETITDVIYEMLKMFEDHADLMKFVVKDNGEEYDMCDISEEIGSDIACIDDDGWLQRFSDIGRIVF